MMVKSTRTICYYDADGRRKQKALGHASFEMTRKYYLAVRSDIIDRERTASHQAMKGISVAPPLFGPKREKSASHK